MASGPIIGDALYGTFSGPLDDFDDARTNPALEEGDGAAAAAPTWRIAPPEVSAVGAEAAVGASHSALVSSFLPLPLAPATYGRRAVCRASWEVLMRRSLRHVNSQHSARLCAALCRPPAASPISAATAIAAASARRLVIVAGCTA